nr:molybdenum metabolism regulator [Deltaproteobacteria bacterium]
HRDLPALTHLALIRYHGCDSLIDALARSPVLRRLRALDLSRGALTDRGLRPILADPAAFAHLTLDVSGTQLSRSGYAKLQRAIPGAVRHQLPG